jgi:NTP pyrophosphatase (non-canonical NTP hydrolase)|tara:strand:+ start:82 stop:477 length:396 start_codon:yes stop_codon:yes gene_type:complete
MLHPDLASTRPQAIAMTLPDLTRRLIRFRDARDWKRFHSLKNLILSTNLEAAELLELTQWKDETEVEAAVRDAEYRRRLAEESADVLLYLLLIAERAGFDLAAAAAAKIEANELKYPVEKARGSARKYTEL